MRTTLFATLLIGLISFSCKSGSSEKTEKPQESASRIIKPKYAQFFEIEISGKDTVIRVLNPWKNRQLIQEIKISGKQPVQSFVPMSTSFYGYLDLLGELDKIVGIENKDFVYNQDILNRLEKGEIHELGQVGVISVEATVQLHPDLVVISGTEVIGPNLSKIGQAGITVLNDMDWQEQHPLGKAEWIKVFGLLSGKLSLADSIFSTIESKYQTLCGELRKQLPTQKVNALLGYNYQGTWFMPGGKSYVAKYLADAGANYPYEKDSTTGSIPLSSELVYKNYSSYPIWLNPGTCRTKSDLLILDARYKNFVAYKTNGVYNNNKRSNAAGGNDFWESSPANPHLVLADLVYIFYPQVLPEHKLYFYHRLE